MDDPLADHLTIPEAAHLLRHNPRTVQRWADTGKLEHIRLGRKIWFPQGSIRDVLGTMSTELSVPHKEEPHTPAFLKKSDDGILMEDYLAEQLTLPETAKILRHVPTTIQEWVKTNQLKCLTVGRNQYFSPIEIRRFVEAGRRKQGFVATDRRRGLSI